MQSKLLLFVEKLLELWAPQSQSTPTVILGKKYRDIKMSRVFLVVLILDLSYAYLIIWNIFI